MTLEEIRRAGLNALMRELGPAGAIRFLRQYETGSGNYAEDRHGWVDEPGVSALAERIRRDSGRDSA